MPQQPDWEYFPERTDETVLEGVRRSMGYFQNRREQRAQKSVEPFNLLTATPLCVVLSLPEVEDLVHVLRGGEVRHQRDIDLAHDLEGHVAGMRPTLQAKLDARNN